MKQHKNRTWKKKYSINETVFEKCDTPEKAYWLGFIMADGNIKGDGQHYVLRFHLQKRDKNHVGKFLKFIDSDVPIREDNHGDYSSIRVDINGKKFVNTLKQYGIIPRKTGKEQIKNIPKEYYPDFIRGYFDGDGCLSIDRRKNKKKESLCFCLICASVKFLEKIQHILMENCRISKTKIVNMYKNDGCYKLAYGGNIQVPRIFNYLLQNSNIQLERKYKLLQEN